VKNAICNLVNCNLSNGNLQFVLRQKALHITCHRYCNIFCLLRYPKKATALCPKTLQLAPRKLVKMQSGIMLLLCFLVLTGRRRLPATESKSKSSKIMLLRRSPKVNRRRIMLTCIIEGGFPRRSAKVNHRE